MTLTITIDWLAVNFKEFTDETEQIVRTYGSLDRSQASNARFGYSQATKSDFGVEFQWNPDRPDMGHHLIFSGSSLRNIFERTQVQPQALLRAVLDAGGSVSRLDLAKDCTGQAIDMQAIYQSLERGDYKGTARTYGRIVSSGNGDTIYIGSRQSERFIRLYDKAAQQGLDGERWFRLELETKGMVARSLALVLMDTPDWGPVFDNVVRNMVWVPGVASWHNFFAQRNVTIGLPKIEKQSDREAWIEGQVVAAVARHYIDNPSSPAVARLIGTLLLIDKQRKE